MRLEGKRLHARILPPYPNTNTEQPNPNPNPDPGMRARALGGRRRSGAAVYWIRPFVSRVKCEPLLILLTRVAFVQWLGSYRGQTALDIAIAAVTARDESTERDASADYQGCAAVLRLRTGRPPSTVVASGSAKPVEVEVAITRG